MQLIINGVTVTPSFAGVVEAGLYQLNVTIPAGLGTGDVPIIATVGRPPDPDRDLHLAPVGFKYAS